MKLRIKEIVEKIREDYYDATTNLAGDMNSSITRGIIAGEFIKGIISTEVVDDDLELTIDDSLYCDIDKNLLVAALNKIPHSDIVHSIHDQHTLWNECEHSKVPIILNNKIALVDKNISVLLSRLDSFCRIVSSSCENVTTRNGCTFISIYVRFVDDFIKILDYMKLDNNKTLLKPHCEIDHHKVNLILSNKEVKEMEDILLFTKGLGYVDMDKYNNNIKEKTNARNKRHNDTLRQS